MFASRNGESMQRKPARVSRILIFQMPLMVVLRQNVGNRMIETIRDPHRRSQAQPRIAKPVKTFIEVRIIATPSLRWALSFLSHREIRCSRVRCPRLLVTGLVLGIAFLTASASVLVHQVPYGGRLFGKVGDRVGISTGASWCWVAQAGATNNAGSAE